MFRVKKLNRKASDAAGASSNARRPRLNDFQLALRRLQRRELFDLPGGHVALRALNEEVRPPRGVMTLLRHVARARTTAVATPISERHFLPTMAEALRVACAAKLARVFESRGLGPCVAALWPAIPAEFDGSPRALIDRDGVLHDTIALQRGRREDIERLARMLPPTEFTPGLLQRIEAAWIDDPTLFKLRLLMTFVADGRALALFSGASPRSTGLSSATPTVTPRGLFRVRLARLVEGVPVLAYVSGVDEANGAIDAGATSAAGHELLAMPAPAVTIVEGKVERWLERYGVAPEAVLAADFQVAGVLPSLLPVDAPASVSRVREALLGKIFRLERQLVDLGFDGAPTLDKLANRVDAQCDRLRGAIAKVAGDARETVIARLSKARGYLRPAGERQDQALSLVHYLNFYGPGFVEDLIESVEVGDGRHHLMFVDKREESGRAA